MPSVRSAGGGTGSSAGPSGTLVPSSTATKGSHTPLDAWSEHDRGHGIVGTSPPAAGAGAVIVSVRCSETWYIFVVST